jgi:hypothetical protein
MYVNFWADDLRVIAKKNCFYFYELRTVFEKHERWIFRTADIYRMFEQLDEKVYHAMIEKAQ